MKIAKLTSGSTLYLNGPHIVIFYSEVTNYSLPYCRIYNLDSDLVWMSSTIRLTSNTLDECIKQSQILIIVPYNPYYQVADSRYLIIG